MVSKKCFFGSLINVFWSLLKMFFLMPKNVFFDPSPCFSRSSDDRLGSCYPAAAAATARPSGAWSFFLPAAAFFRFELRARNCFFEQHNNNKIKIFRRHVRQFWYLPAAGEAAAAAARGLAAWCFSSADVREFLGAVLAAAGGSGTRSSFRSVVFPPGNSSKYRTRSSSSNSCSSRGFWRGSSSSSMRTSNSRRQQNLSKNVVFLGFQTTR